MRNLLYESPYYGSLFAPWAQQTLAFSSEPRSIFYQHPSPSRATRISSRFIASPTSSTSTPSTILTMSSACRAGRSRTTPLPGSSIATSPILSSPEQWSDVAIGFFPMHQELSRHDWPQMALSIKVRRLPCSWRAMSASSFTCSVF